MKRFASFLLLVSACLLFVACSKEKSTIDKMTDLSEKVENADDPESLDWTELSDEYKEILADAEDCDFSDSERSEFYRQQGKFHAAMLKYAVQQIPDLLDDATDAAAGYMQGIMEGLDSESE